MINYVNNSAAINTYTIISDDNSYIDTIKTELTRNLLHYHMTIIFQPNG